MTVEAKPYGQLRYRNVHGKQMAYVDEGHGASAAPFEPRGRTRVKTPAVSQ
jgi:hypothetical protein